MYMIHPAYLMDVLERLVDGEVPNQIVVSEAVQAGSLLALNRMLAILKLIKPTRIRRSSIRSMPTAGTPGR